MNWQPGDQAMCIKRFDSSDPTDLKLMARTGRPVPPLVYDVVDVQTPPPHLIKKFPRLRGVQLLQLKGFGTFYWRSDHFRKCEPLPPEPEELEIGVPVREPETV